MTNQPSDLLKHYWGHQTFREPQAEIIDSLLKGEDVFAMLPTGGGKSICYQIPALLVEGITLVISPLISLMVDQVNALQKMGINAAFLNSSQSKTQQDIALEKLTKKKQGLLYLSPEKLSSEWFMERLIQLKVGLIAIDEAHCVSEWGFDFRPDYRTIKQSCAHIAAPLIALTASATREVQTDIIQELGLKNPRVFSTGVFRANLSYQVVRLNEKEKRLMELLALAPKDNTIVYVQSRKGCAYLSGQAHKAGLKSVVYHAGLSRADRELAQNRFINGDAPLIFATNAFGMGIDKADVRRVIHYGAPSSLEAYYQEAGRSGRDGNPATVMLLQGPNDLAHAKKMLEQRFQPLEHVISVFNALVNALQIAEGYFSDSFYVLDIPALKQKTGLEFIELHYCLKLLELSGVIYYQQEFYTPSKLQITASPSAVYELCENHLEVSAVLKSLIRLYGSDIYEDQLEIKEMSLSSMAQISQAKLNQVLDFLAKRGAIRYFKGTDKPVVQLAMPRPKVAALPLKVKLFEFLKQREIARIEAMDQYSNTAQCKQQALSHYFGFESEPCGLCSSCVEAQDYSSDVLRLIVEASNPLNLMAIQRQMPSLSQADLTSSVNLLLASGKIKRDALGCFGVC